MVNGHFQQGSFADVLRERADVKQAEYMGLMHEQMRISIRLEGIKSYIQSLNGLLQAEGLAIIHLRDSSATSGVGKPGNRSKDMPLRKPEWDGMALLQIAGTILSRSSGAIHADVMVPLIFEVESAPQHKKAKHSLVSTLRAGAKKGLWEALPKNQYRGVTASPRLLGV
ncbi:MAG: hypothetical protein Q7K03_11980 [Dehalococcoidia bacterium]|nr:hypothetical protein [Dehalococcoidia bacterium]